MKGKIEEGKYAYQRITRVYPIKKEYGEDSCKWICPVCSQLNNPHQLTKGDVNCPLCNVNLCWENDNK